MATDFDGEVVSFSNAGLRADEDSLAPVDDKLKIRKQMREFIRTFRLGPTFPYRDQLLQRWRKRETFLEIDFAHLSEYDTELLALVCDRPIEFLPLFESAIRDALEKLVVDNANENKDEDDIPDMQLFVKSSQIPIQLRNVNAEHVNRLIKVSGIVISASRAQSKAVHIECRCTACGNKVTVACASGFQGAALPQMCDMGGQISTDGKSCGPRTFVVMPDSCTYVDQQTLKLQEAPEVVPTGEMPRNIVLSMDRNLVDKVSPGTRVSVIGIASLYNNSRGPASQGAVRSLYIKVVGVEVESEGAGRANTLFTPEEEQKFIEMAANPRIYDLLVTSLAPSISGDYTEDIKKALACQLLGGSRKVLPDGMRLRGDINVLLLGDPSTAKSQFLKFIEKVAPVGVYTSGKGSSAAGLTASVTRDQRGEFYLEGGAMVLADGGICCIDEFDKMREQDRVAIHEAMEQQTISIAKAGITTVLNSRTSVLAAANPIFGRYDELRSAADNIDLMSTILSRFDLIFIVRDIRDEERDRAIARHVMSVHINAAQGGTEGVSASVRDGSSLDLKDIKKFVTYCRSRCAPRLSKDTASLLSSEYVKIRLEMKDRCSEQGDDAQAVPITVRQLEALVRISESLAKMELKAEVEPRHIDEAIRLFKVSTGSAASYSPSSLMTFANEDTQKAVERAEAYLRNRLPMHSKVNTSRIVEEAVGQRYAAPTIKKAIGLMVMKSELKEFNHGRLVERIR